MSPPLIEIIAVATLTGICFYGGAIGAMSGIAGVSIGMFVSLWILRRRTRA